MFSMLSVTTVLSYYPRVSGKKSTKRTKSINGPQYVFRGRINTEVMEVENVEDGTGLYLERTLLKPALSSEPEPLFRCHCCATQTLDLFSIMFLLLVNNISTCLKNVFVKRFTPVAGYESGTCWQFGWSYTCAECEQDVALQTLTTPFLSGLGVYFHLDTWTRWMHRYGLDRVIKVYLLLWFLRAPVWLVHSALLHRNTFSLSNVFPLFVASSHDLLCAWFVAC